MIMNKLVNLILILLTLKFVVPFSLSYLPYITQTEMLTNGYIGLLIALVQFIYNYIMKVSNKNKMNVYSNLYDSIFKGLIVFTSLVIYLDFKNEYNIQFNNIQEETFKVLFVTFFVTCFVLFKCLLTP